MGDWFMLFSFCSLVAGMRLDLFVLLLHFVTRRKNCRNEQLEYFTTTLNLYKKIGSPGICLFFNLLNLSFFQKMCIFNFYVFFKNLFLFK